MLPFDISDEVFNYWEPLAYLQFGTGFQTWEYSPEYAIRSWFYIFIHAFIGFGLELFQLQKIHIFYCIRLILGLFSAACEAFLYESVSKHVHPNVANLFLIFSIFAPGLFIASPAFLPSSFAMYFITLAFAFICKPASRMRTWSIVFCIGVASLVGIYPFLIKGWPFAGALAFPVIIEAMTSRLRVSEFKWMLESSVLTLGSVVPLMMCIDFVFYRKWIFVPWNIIAYNVFNVGPDLYGTEPWYYYILNLILNFNLAFIAALMSIPMILFTLLLDRKILKRETSFMKLLFRLSYFYLWFIIFTLQAHKEERFMYVVYPMICFNASVALFLGKEMLSSFLKQMKLLGSYSGKISKGMIRLFLLLFVILSISRILALHQYYHADMDVYKLLNEADKPSELKREITLCLGDNWYKFPSTFFLPNGYRVGFIEEEFKGLLPKYFNEHDRLNASAYLEQGKLKEYVNFQSNSVRLTHEIPTGMNNLNKQENDRYMMVFIIKLML